MRFAFAVTCALLTACAPNDPVPVPVAEAIADSTCALVKATQHPDAIALVTEFTARDQRGEFLQSSAFFDGAVTCPGHEPGPDTWTMVRGHELHVLHTSADSAVVEVLWDRVEIGDSSGHAVVHGVEHDTLRVYPTPYGWRIASPALRPRRPVPPAPPLP